MVSEKDLKEINQDNQFRGLYKGSRELSGEILTFWDKTVYHMINCEINEYWVGMTLRILKRNLDFVIVNVYVPQTLKKKRNLWNSFSQVFDHCSCNNLHVFFIGDFNCTRL